MKVNFGETVPLSTLDWPGKATITVFLRGCPFRCLYCQNHELLASEEIIDLEEVESKILETERYIDGVVVSGGDPLQQPEVTKELGMFSRENELGFGLHTNGYYPHHLKELIDQDLLDFTSIDIKAPLDEEEKYQRICGKKIDVDRIKKSLNILKKSEIELEITTTFFDYELNKSDLEKIKNSIKDEKFVVQQGRTENAYKEEIKKIDSIEKNSLIDLAKKIDYSNIYVRTKQEGEEKV
ncbi:anaerobic ribonucleoside-triphosphate reductase activating protein [archaeon SCG-AAA382B04]|nr:anaerobic ribonucleoside-triphosphate reductase activating protein [archaeon SCG-AAA382B04]